MTKLNSKGNVAKRRNHTVPRSLLCEWIASKPPRQQGIYFIDCNDGILKFEEGGQANFAVSEYLYVPIGTDGYRDERMEDWFSPDENALVTLSRETTSKSFGKAMKPHQKANAIRASIILGYRSHYEFGKIAEIVQSLNSSLNSAEIQQKVVSHFWAIYESKLKQFQSWSFTIFHSLPERLLICDRPLLDLTVHKDPQAMVILPISPNAFLMGTPGDSENRASGNQSATLTWIDASTSGLAAFINHQAIVRAREFLVGDPDQLAAVANQMNSSQINERKRLDKFVKQAL